MKSGCKPKKTLRMAVGGGFSDPYRDASLKHVQAGMFGTTAPAPATTHAGGDFGPGRNPRAPLSTDGQTLDGVHGGVSTTVISNKHDPGPGARPAVEPPTMASQPTLRSATAPTLTPSALEQRLNDRMNAGTLTIRGAGMLQGMEDSRRQAEMQRYGIDTQANTSQYNTDKQWDSNRYSTDQQLKGSMYGHDMSYKGQLADIDARKYIADMNNDTNLKQIDAGIYNNTMSNNTQNSIADKNQQTALANLQNQYDMNQQNINASVFNNLASRSRSFGLRNGGEIHAANGFMPGGYAERGAAIEWLSPYDGIKAQASLADMDLKQDYMRAQTEALRAQVERARGPSQDEVNATRMSADQARQRFLWEGDDRTKRNKMTQTAFDTKMRNDLQDRALAMQDRELALRNAQEQKIRDNIRYVDGLNAAQRAGIIENNRRQDAAAVGDPRLDFARQQYADAQSRQQMQDALEGQRYNDAWARTGRLDALAKQQYDDSRARTGRLDDFGLRQYADSQARTGRLDEFAKQQYGDTLARTGRLDDFAQRQYADARSDRLNATAEEQRRYDAAQRVDADRYGQAQRRLDAEDSLRLRSFNDSMERAKRDDAYIAQSRADARSRQLEGDFYAREDRARNYDMLQQANARLNENRRGPMSLDPRFTHANGVPRFGLRHGGSPAIDNGLGGAVPGTGKGDKIPAMYEPNEFVVSNDMLKAEPGLRDHLRGLRERVLAQKGMTPEEADAKAIHMDSEGPGDERGAKDERESKAVKRGFGLRAKFGGDAIFNEETDFMPDVMTERLTDEENAALLKKYPKLPSPEPKKELPGLFDSRKAAKKTEPPPQISMSKIAENGYGSDATSGMFDGEQVPTKEQAARIEREYNMGGRAANDAQTSTTKYVDAQGNPRVGLAQWFNWTNGYREAPSASESAPPDAQDLGARDRQLIAPPQAASKSPSNAATQEEMSTTFDSKETPTKPAAKDTAPVLHGAAGKNVGFGITRFDVPGQSPLFTNMTDEAGMRSNEALISRKPQSEQDRIAGDNLAARSNARLDAEARMAQRQAELQAEYQQGQIDNRAIDSRARQTELAKEIENLNTHLSSRSLSPEEYRRGEKQMELLQAARLGEGANFGARENALALDQARSAATIGVHAGDNASRERIADKELAAKAPGYALDRELTQEKISHERELNAAQKGYAGAIAAGDKNAADMYREQIVALSNKLSDSKFSAIPGRVVPDPMGGEPHVIPPTIWDSHSGQIVQQKGGANQVARSISPGEVVNGFRFKGGNTKDRNNWEKV